jgi:hypothetical protein
MESTWFVEVCLDLYDPPGSVTPEKELHISSTIKYEPEKTACEIFPFV